MHGPVEPRIFRYLGTEGEKGVRVSDYLTGEESVIEVEHRDFLTMDLIPGKHLFELHARGWRTQTRAGTPPRAA